MVAKAKRLERLWPAPRRAARWRADAYHVRTWCAVEESASHSLVWVPSSGGGCQRKQRVKPLHCEELVLVSHAPGQTTSQLLFVLPCIGSVVVASGACALWRGAACFALPDITGGGRHIWR